MAFLFGALLAIEMLNEEEKVRSRARFARRMLRDANNPFTASDHEFLNTFRLNKDACLYIIHKLKPVLSRSQNSNTIPVHLRVLCALNYLVVGSHQRSAVNNLSANLSESMVSLIVSEFVSSLVHRCMRGWIHFSRNDDKKCALKSRFFKVHHMHNIIGIVDGTQIAIVKPRMPIQEKPFLNKRGYHSINVQIICDANAYILNIVARWPGSTPDSFIWGNSTVGRAMCADYELSDENSAIMGDSGYPCLPWLYVPVACPVTQQEKAYNNAFTRARSTVERSIGILKGRFKCLLKERPLRYKPKTACQIIMACAILHNIAKKYRVEDPELELDVTDFDPPVPPPPAPDDDVYRERGQEVRRNYIRQYF